MAIAAAAAVRLPQTDQGELRAAKKGATLTPLFPSTDSAPTLATSFAKISSRFDVGNNPELEFRLLWTKGAGTLLTVAYKTSFDDGSSTPYAYEAEFGQPSSGVYTSAIAQVTFDSTTWADAGITDGTTILHLKFRPVLRGARFIELWAKSDAAAGSVSGYAMAGAAI